MKAESFENNLIDIEDIIKKMDVVMTPEEKKEQREKEKQELISMGFLPCSEEYTSGMSAPMEMVENNPRVYIIKECLLACQELWSKNIYTFMVSDYLDTDGCWIEIDLDNLSEENKEIYNNLTGDGLFKFSYHQGCVNFGVNCIGAKAQQKLLELAQQFKMQEVPYLHAYITLEEYLIMCGCCDEIENPKYIEMIEPLMADIPLDEMAEYLIEYDEWKDSDRSKKTIKVFNPLKVTKPLEKYFEDTGYIYDGERVYKSEYHYQKHLNYVNGIKQNKL